MSAPSFYILCGNAAYNRGDRGNLAAQIDLLRSRFPGSRIIVGSYRSTVDRMWYDAEVVPRGFFLSKKARNALKESDVVIWGGGALIADNSCKLLIPFWWLQLFFIKRVLKKPVMAWAHGIVTETGIGRWLGRKTYAFTDRITVRDGGSMKKLRDMGVIAPPHVQTADPAVLLEPADERTCESILKSEGIPLRDRPLMIIAATFWPFQQRSSDILPYMLARRIGLRRNRERSPEVKKYLQSLSQLAQKLIDECGTDVLFVPVYPSSRWPDVRLLESVIEKTERLDRVFLLRHDDYAPKEYLSLWHRAAGTVSTSLHHGIFAHIMDSPSVMISYEPKCAEFCTAAGTADRMIGLQTFCSEGGAGMVTQQLQSMLREWPMRRERVRSALQNLKERAEENADELGIMMKGYGWNSEPQVKELDLLLHTS